MFLGGPCFRLLGRAALPFRLNHLRNSIGDISYDFEGVRTRLKRINVNKSAGVDDIHHSILYELRNRLAVPLSIISEHSYRNENLPVEWESANVSPIFKTY